ncbi:MAG: hypothetical protein JWP49_459 [Phenylobacterium sp.]|nr:hypothetical protein [Phenylobacterium sp.]
MTDDRRPSSATAERDDAHRGGVRSIPPLVWIVIFLLVAALGWAWVERGGHDTTRQGGATPSQAEGTAYMPAAPANGSAPATPAGQLNGPQQPHSNP